MHSLFLRIFALSLVTALAGCAIFDHHKTGATGRASWSIPNPDGSQFDVTIALPAGQDGPLSIAGKPGFALPMTVRNADGATLAIARDATGQVTLEGRFAVTPPALSDCSNSECTNYVCTSASGMNCECWDDGFADTCIDYQCGGGGGFNPSIDASFAAALPREF